jgi:hypothetical protein
MKPERRVWIVQCLCPARHCIAAVTAEADSIEGARPIERELRRQLDEMMIAGAINPWCGLCGAERPTWRYETARTRFATMAEAQPELERSQAEQAVVNALFRDMPRGRPN